MTARSTSVNRWESLPAISGVSPMSTSRNGDVIKLRYSHASSLPYMTSTAINSFTTDFNLQCPGTSSSEPIWYSSAGTEFHDNDLDLSTSSTIADVDLDDQQSPMRSSWLVDTVEWLDSTSPQLSAKDKDAMSSNTEAADDGDTSTDFGLKAARVRIENRVSPRPSDCPRRKENPPAQGSYVLKSDCVGDVTEAGEVNWRRTTRRARDLADGGRTKKMNGRLSKHQQHRWVSDSQLLNSPASASNSVADSDLGSCRRRPAARVSVAGGRQVRCGGTVTTATSLCGLATVSRSMVASKSRIGPADNRHTLSVSRSQPVMTSLGYADYNVVNLTGSSTATVQGDDVKRRSTDKEPSSTPWLYADPVTDAPVDFQQRLAQMAFLEADTRRTERQTAVLAKAKKKQQTQLAAAATTTTATAAAAASVAGPAAAANIAVITGTKGKEKDTRDGVS